MKIYVLMHKQIIKLHYTLRLTIILVISLLHIIHWFIIYLSIKI